MEWGLLAALLIVPMVASSVIGVAIKVVLKVDTDMAMRYGEIVFLVLVILFFAWITALTL